MSEPGPGFAVYQPGLAEVIPLRPDQAVDDQVLTGEVVAAEPDALAGWLADADRPDILPAALRGAENLRLAMRAAVGRARHRAGYHGVRLPLYGARMLRWAPVGAARLSGRVLAWWWVAESREVRQAARAAGDVHGWRDVVKDVRRIRARRFLMLATIGPTSGCAAAAAWGALPWWLQAPAAAAAIAALARHGKPGGAVLVDAVAQPSRWYRLTGELARAAIIACGVGVKDPEQITLVADIVRDGPGHRAVLDLPGGVTAEAVISKRTELAGALRLPKSQVWPATLPGQHPSRLELWVRESAEMEASEWPLLRRGDADYWRGVPYGFDERDRPVVWRLEQRNSLFAGQPGSGKSLAARIVLLGAVLDPLVIPIVINLKGSGDFRAFQPLCPDGGYVVGADEATKQEAMRVLRWLVAECDRRAPLVDEWVLKLKLADDAVTREMAARDPRLRPIVALWDELQELLTDRELGKEAAALLTSLIKRARALGIHLILCTQRIDKTAIPPGISTNVANRCCLSVVSATEVNTALGEGMYGRGARPTEFVPGDDSGWGWVVGAGKIGPVKAAYVDNRQIGDVIARAVAMRDGRPGALDGPAEPVRDLLADVAAVIVAAGRDRLPWEIIAMELAVGLGGAYADLTPAGLSERVRDLAPGVQSIPVAVGDRRPRGCLLAEVRAAITARGSGSGAEGS